MIVDKTQGKLEEIKEFAKKNNLTGKFKRAFSSFENYSKKGFIVTLFDDFAPYSLLFSVSKNKQQVLFGGFIFHGQHDNFGDGGAPTFSVSLSQTKETGWSIHT